MNKRPATQRPSPPPMKWHAAKLIPILFLVLTAFVLGGGGRLRADQPEVGAAKVTQTAADIHVLIRAISEYRKEYLRMPSSADAARLAKDAACISTDDAGKLLLRILSGVEFPRNPREIRFLDPSKLSPAKTDGSGYSPEFGLRDAWGKNGYKIILDLDGDGNIADPAGVVREGLNGTVFIYSAGPDGDFATWADNVSSWK